VHTQALKPVTNEAVQDGSITFVRHSTIIIMRSSLEIMKAYYIYLTQDCKTCIVTITVIRVVHLNIHICSSVSRAMMFSGLLVQVH